MHHQSFHEYIFLVSANDVMEHFAFPGNIDFAADDQGAFHVILIPGCCVYSSSVKQCLPSVNHEQFPIQMAKWHRTAMPNVPSFFPQPLGGLILTHLINTTVLSSPLLFVSLNCESKTRGILRQLYCSFVYIPHLCRYSSLARNYAANTCT